MNIIFIILLFFCHFLADYTHLSRPFMLKAKKFGEPLSPIFMHACVHGLLMAFVMMCFGLDYWLLTGLWAFQVITHFIIDDWKGKMNKWFPSLQNPANTWHWVVFGGDQYLHTVVIILMGYYSNIQ